jgi:hypothetical protein
MAQGSDQKSKHLVVGHAQHVVCEANESVCGVCDVDAVVKVVVWDVLVGFAQLQSHTEKASQDVVDIDEGKTRSYHIKT